VKTLKLALSDLLSPAHYENSLWEQLLRQRYEVVLTKDFATADLLIYSDWGTDHQRFHGRKIYVSGENMEPDYNECDFAVTSLVRPNDPKHYRLPYYVTSVSPPELLVKPASFDAEKVLKSKTGFCSFVASNPRGPQRNRFFKILNRGKRVDSGGKHFNNVGHRVAKKREFLGKYKFNIAFENSLAAGYTTEKLIDAMLANSIPIYWGNPEITREFNTRSFINADEFANLEALADHVLKVDADDALYLSYLREPWFIDNRVPDAFRLEPLRDALVSFIESAQGPGPRRYRKRRLREQVYQSALHQSIVSFACRVEGALWKIGVR
jgi:hypothetical protein